MPRPSVREHIVEAALTEFHRRGFTACSVEDITKAAGVPKGSFYNHFKSKDELAAEVVGRYTTDAEWNTVPAGDLSPLRFCAPASRKWPKCRRATTTAAVA